MSALPLPLPLPCPAGVYCRCTGRSRDRFSTPRATTGSFTVHYSSYAFARLLKLNGKGGVAHEGAVRSKERPLAGARGPCLAVSAVGCEVPARCG